MKIAICQINTIIGDLEKNKNKIIELYQKGVKDNVDLVIFPELSTCGYPPLDLVEKKEFRDAVNKLNLELASITKDTGLLFGTITEKIDDVGTDIFNSAMLCYDGKIQFVQNKTLIPNYDVFDEVRYFESATDNSLHTFRNEKLGVSICEDIWNDADYWNKRRYTYDPVHKLIEEGASIILNISASPYAYGKRKQKYEMLKLLSKTNSIPLVYTCCAGAQTELIFDGGSMCFDSNGNLCQIGKKYEEDYFTFDTKKSYIPITKIEAAFEEEVLDALILGVKDYCAKTGFKRVLVGLSGGMDSALVTYIATKALGNENVKVLLLPSKYSSKGSIDDSMKLIGNLDISFEKISIENIFDTILKTIEQPFNKYPEDVTEENIQSRIRGLLLMAFANKEKYLLLTTGNKSEVATGYATLYGDMCGGLSVIGDIYKTQVYKIANYINRENEIIPDKIIKKPPSAELRPNQTDQDTLPPYDLLDKILEMYLEEYLEYEEIIDRIGNPDIVKGVLAMVDRNEFKRRQGAPILRVSTKAFGYGRRFPIVQGWKRN